MSHLTRIHRVNRIRRAAEIDLDTRRADRLLLPVAEIFTRYA